MANDKGDDVRRSPSPSPSEDTTLIDSHLPTDSTPQMLDAIAVKIKNTYYRTLHHLLSPTVTPAERQQYTAEFRLAIEDEIPHAAAEDIEKIVFLVSTFREEAKLRAYLSTSLK